MTLDFNISSKLTRSSSILGILSSVILIIFLFWDHNSPVFENAVQMSIVILPIWFTWTIHNDESFNVKLYPSFILACLLYSICVLIYIPQNYYPIYSFGITVLLFIIFYIIYGNQIFTSRTPWYNDQKPK